MLIAKNAQKLDLAARSHLSELLDEALEETFPASDPIAIQVELNRPSTGQSQRPSFALRSEARARR